jgi:hypothetical protein
MRSPIPLSLASFSLLSLLFSLILTYFLDPFSYYRSFSSSLHSTFYFLLYFIPTLFTFISLTLQHRYLASISLPLLYFPLCHQLILCWFPYLLGSTAGQSHTQTQYIKQLAHSSKSLPIFPFPLYTPESGPSSIIPSDHDVFLFILLFAALLTASREFLRLLTPALWESEQEKKRNDKRENEPIYGYIANYGLVSLLSSVYPVWFVVTSPDWESESGPTLAFLVSLLSMRVVRGVIIQAEQEVTRLNQLRHRD